MLGLGASILASSGSYEVKDFSDGEYAKLATQFILESPGVTDPIVLHSSNNISFDDTLWEIYGFETGGSGDARMIYREIIPSEYHVASGTVTISGRITERDTTDTVQDANDDGFVIVSASSASNLNEVKIWVNEAYGGSLASNEVKVDSNGDFSKAVTATYKYHTQDDYQGDPLLKKWSKTVPFGAPIYSLDYALTEDVNK